MSEIYLEFLDQNLHRSYPFTDESGAKDTTNSLQLPTSLITDIYLCAPNLPYVDKSNFYVSNVLIRRYFIDITISYVGLSRPVGVFKNISTTAQPQTAYDFTPSELQTGDQWSPLYFMSGQILIGDPTESIRYLGSWNFSQSDDEHSTKIVSTRVAKGLMNVQYISINERLFTGVVRLKEGSNVSFDVDTRTVAGVPETVVTINATINTNSNLQLSNDADVLAALTNKYGRPLRTINGLLPDLDRNFLLEGADCTTVAAGGGAAVVISNPCAAPCCDEDANINSIMESIANMNLRYAQLKSFFEASATALNGLQNKLLVLGAEV